MVFGIKDIKKCVSLAYRRCEMVDELIGELRDVLYGLKRMGLRTERC